MTARIPVIPYVGMPVLVKSRNDLREGVVAKVGRKWVTLQDGARFEFESGFSWPLDNGDMVSVARAWINAEALEEHLVLKKDWDAFRAALPYTMPEHLTLEHLALLKTILGEDV